MLIVSGHVDIDPSDIGDFVTDIEWLASSARSREGCLFYAVALENGSTRRMLVSERWRDQGALTAHLSAIETVAFIERWSGRMRGDIRKFDVMNERGLADE